MCLFVVVRDAGGDGEVVAELEAAHQSSYRSHAPFRIRGLGAARIAAEVQAHLLRQRGARLQIDDTAQAAFTILRGGILDDVDSADFFARDAFEGCVLEAAVAAAARGLTRYVDLPAGEEHLAVQSDEVVAQSVDQHLRALAAGTVDGNARQALQRLRHVLVGHLADILGNHRLDRLDRDALGIQGGLQRLAVARDDDLHEIVRRVGLLRSRRCSGRRCLLCRRGCAVEYRRQRCGGHHRSARGAAGTFLDSMRHRFFHPLGKLYEYGVVTCQPLHIAPLSTTELM